MSRDYLSFEIDPAFVAQYVDKTPPWGFSVGGGNSLGEITFIRTYSRKKPDGTKERWHEVCERVISGMYTLMKDHVETNKIFWDEEKAQRSAKEAFDRMFNMKWLPPGRGLWMMGTRFVHERGDSTALNNCAFTSTVDLPADAAWLMEASMLGVGVGFGTESAGKETITEPDGTFDYVIPDTREGWAKSAELLLRAYINGAPKPVFDYSEIRAKGEPIKGFGGLASGPKPLREYHESIVDQFEGRAGETLTSVDILDVMNKAGRCVVAGNVRRSAELALGDINDMDFIEAKNYEKNPERAAWGWISNNSVIAEVGDTPHDKIAEGIVNNGEPGIFYRDLVRKYGRMIDPPNNKDHRVVGTNPCSEQSLEHREMCCLVETFPIKADSLEDFKQTLKYAYLYAKAVTLMPTGWEETNQVMLRNRRIGTSMSGLAEFIEKHTMTELREWMDQGYQEIQMWDKTYSEWLCIRESIKTTSIKPSGTVSLLAGVTPGVHWMPDTVYIRRIRVAIDHPLVHVAQNAGYHVEPAETDPEGTAVIEFPVRGPKVRNEREVTIWEKAALAIIAQRYWSDNQVSCTITFSKDEAKHIGDLLRVHEGQLKSVSFLQIQDQGEHDYAQLPYEGITEEQYQEAVAQCMPMDTLSLYEGLDTVDAVGEKYCTTDKCEIPVHTTKKEGVLQ